MCFRWAYSLSRTVARIGRGQRLGPTGDGVPHVLPHKWQESERARTLGIAILAIGDGWVAVRSAAALGG